MLQAVVLVVQVVHQVVAQAVMEVAVGLLLLEEELQEQTQNLIWAEQEEEEVIQQ